MEQFTRNENKMVLNEPTATIEARTLITICIQVLRQVSTIADRMLSAWDGYFPLNGDSGVHLDNFKASPRR